MYIPSGRIRVIYKKNQVPPLATEVLDFPLYTLQFRLCGNGSHTRYTLHESWIFDVKLPSPPPSTDNKKTVTTDFLSIIYHFSSLTSTLNFCTSLTAVNSYISSTFVITWSEDIKFSLICTLQLTCFHPHFQQCQKNYCHPHRHHHHHYCHHILKKEKLLLKSTNSDCAEYNIYKALLHPHINSGYHKDILTK